MTKVPFPPFFEPIACSNGKRIQIKCKYNRKFNAGSVFVGSKMLCLLDASKVDDALALVTDLSDTLEDRTLEVRLHAFYFLSTPNVMKCGDNAAVKPWPNMPASSR